MGSVMKRMKKWLKIGILTSVCFLCGVLGACNPNGGDSSFSSKSVTLSEESVRINVYDGFTLETELVGLSGDVSWTSSNEEVLLVENGVVRAIETGTAVVTAELNGYKDTCSFTVHNEELRVPTLEVDAKTISFAKDDEYIVTADMSYNGTSIPKSYNYTWTVNAEDSDTVSITPIVGTNGKQAKIKGLDYGTAECYVTVNAVGEELVNVVNVTVLQPAPSIFLTNFSQDQGKYTVNLSAVDANNGADVSSIIPEITVIENGATVENAELVWGDGESDVAVMEQGAIKATGVGTTTFTLTYKQTQVNVEVNVYRPYITIDETLEFETAAPTITYTSTLIGTGEKVYFKGNEIGTVTNKTIAYDLSQSQYVLGEATTATLWTDKVIYEFKAIVYTKVIKTIAEFQKIRDYDPTGVKLGNFIFRQGYYVLGADLDFGGKTHTVCNFMGTFDGRGYTVYNMNLQKAGLFAYLRESAVIKNVNIKGAVLDVSGNAGVVARQGFNGFTISNVYAEVKYVGTISTSGSFGAGFIGQKLYNGYSQDHDIENCVMIVDVSGLTANGEATASCFVGFVQHNPTLCADGKNHQSSEIFNLRNSLALVVGEDNDGCTVSSYYGSQSFTATTVSPYVYPNVTNTKVLRGVEEYQEWIEGGNTSDYDEVALQFIRKYVQENIMTVALETQGDPDINMYNQKASITLTDLLIKDSNGEKLTLEGATVQSLKVGAQELLGNIATISATGELTLTSPTNCLINELGTYRGQTCLTLTTFVDSGKDKGKTFVYTIPVTLADYVITTATEYRELSNKLVAANTLESKQNTLGTTTVWTNGYFVLGQDIDFAGKQIVDTTNAKRVSLFGGVFDGQGYTMTKPIFYNNAMFEYVRDGSQVKNVKIVDAAARLSGGPTGIVARMASKGFNVSNVYVEVSIEKNPASYRFGFITRHYAGGTNEIIQDCTVVASVNLLEGATGVSVGLFIGDNADSENKNASTSTKQNYGKVTLKNCIGIITDTNDNGYTVSGNVGSIFDTEKSGSTFVNCNYYANWTAYEFATLNGYNADMLAFITNCKA